MYLLGDIINLTLLFIGSATKLLKLQRGGPCLDLQSLFLILIVGMIIPVDILLESKQVLCLLELCREVFILLFELCDLEPQLHNLIVDILGASLNGLDPSPFKEVDVGPHRVGLLLLS